jgi:hypothetical protein
MPRKSPSASSRANNRKKQREGNPTGLELARAIDELVDHIVKGLFGRPFKYKNTSGHWRDEDLDGKMVVKRLHHPVGGHWHKSFERLDRTVWIEAVRIGLSGELPPKYDAPATSFLGKTNLPHMANAVGPSGPSVFARWHQVRRWRDEMTALHELAEKLALDTNRGQQSKRGAPEQNKARNAWIVKQREKGRTYGDILADLPSVCEKRGWRPVTSEQAIHAAYNTQKSKIKSNMERI